MCNLKAQTIVSRAVISVASLFYPVTHPVILSLFISRVSFTCQLFLVSKNTKKQTNTSNKPSAGRKQFLYYILKFILALSVGILKIFIEVKVNG